MGSGIFCFLWWLGVECWLGGCGIGGMLLGGGGVWGMGVVFGWCVDCRDGGCLWVCVCYMKCVGF